MKKDILVKDIDLELLRKQRDYLIKQKSCDELEGLINMLDYMLDEGERCPICNGEVCPQEDLEYEDIDLTTGDKNTFKLKDGTLACSECAWFEGSENMTNNLTERSVK